MRIIQCFNGLLKALALNLSNSARLQGKDLQCMYNSSLDFPVASFFDMIPWPFCLPRLNLMMHNTKKTSVYPTACSAILETFQPNNIDSSVEGSLLRLEEASSVAEWNHRTPAKYLPKYLPNKKAKSHRCPPCS
uniref:Uncharacterized protein n=1 Tax=Sphaerodactylus townsendi TaxID=933632 RepID=A0ACB8EUQ1_9SAUR